MRQHVTQPGFEGDTVQLGRADQRIDRGGAFATAVGAGEEVVTAADGDATQGALGRRVIDLNGAVVLVAQQCGPEFERVYRITFAQGEGPLRQAACALAFNSFLPDCCSFGVGHPHLHLKRRSMSWDFNDSYVARLAAYLETRSKATIHAMSYISSPFPYGSSGSPSSLRNLL